MGAIIMTASNVSTTSDSSDFRQFLLSQIKVEALGWRLRAAEAIEVGHALACSAIGTSDAIAEMVDLGASLTIPSSIAGPSS